MHHDNVNFCFCLLSLFQATANEIRIILHDFFGDLCLELDVAARRSGGSEDCVRHRSGPERRDPNYTIGDFSHGSTLHLALASSRRSGRR